MDDEPEPPAGPPRQPPPGPRGHPLIGSALALRHDPLGTLLSAQREFGDVVRFVVGPPARRRTFVAVFHPEAVRRVLAAESRRYTKDSVAYREVAALIGDGLLTSQGQTWRRQRRTVQPLFTPKHVAGYAAIMGEEASALVARLRPSVGHRDGLDLHAEMVRFTLRVVGRAVFGADVDEALDVVQTAVPTASEYAFRRTLSVLPLPRGWPTPANRRAGRAQRAMYRIVDELIRRRRREGLDPERGDLLSLLLLASDPETGTGLADREVRDQALVFLLAGHETTATATTMALDAVSRRPDVQARVHGEVDAVLGGRLPVAADLFALGYIGQVIKEAMRLYPPAYWVERFAPEDVVIGGYWIAARTGVILSPWVTHRHPVFWPEPDRFDPDRFDGRGDSARHPYAYLPFGGGPRSCIGEHFALLEAVVLLATVVQAFELRAVGPPPRLSAAVTLRPAGRVPCDLSAR